MTWDDDAVDLLRQLWMDPELSTGVIGLRLGCSPNAAIGKAKRIGLPERGRRPRSTTLAYNKIPRIIRTVTRAKQPKPKTEVARPLPPKPVESMTKSEMRADFEQIWKNTCK